MKKIRIILYHRIENLPGDYNMLAVTPENFMQHMKWISEKYEILQLSEPMSNWFINDERDAVIVTFDDGYYDWLYKAAPILSKYKIPATMFITTGNIGTQNELWTDNLHRAIFESKKYNDYFELKDNMISSIWGTRCLQEKVNLYISLRKIFQISSKKKRKEFEKQLLEWAGITESGRPNRRILSKEEVQKLAKIEGISIGAHCVSHPSLKWLSKREKEYEIVKSKKTLENITGQEIELFSYPFGTKNDYSEETIDALRRYGFKKAVTGFTGKIEENTDIYQLPRFTIRNYDIEHFKDYMENVVFRNKDYIIPKAKKREVISYIGRYEDDEMLFNGKESIVIWGIGESGRKLLKSLIADGMVERVLAFGDNDLSKHGLIINGKPVLNLTELESMQMDKVYLVKGTYDWEICKGLIEKNIKNIHWIII